jgi:hypothetical protein
VTLALTVISRNVPTERAMDQCACGVVHPSNKRASHRERRKRRQGSGPWSWWESEQTREDLANQPDTTTESAADAEFKSSLRLTSRPRLLPPVGNKKKREGAWPACTPGARPRLPYVSAAREPRHARPRRAPSSVPRARTRGNVDDASFRPSASHADGDMILET